MCAQALALCMLAQRWHDVLGHREWNRAIINVITYTCFLPSMTVNSP